MNAERDSSMRILTLIAILAAAASQAAAQTAPQQEMLEHWRRATVSLGQLSTNGEQQYTTIGSAVIIAVDEHHGCILTAKHMVSDPRKGWKPTEIRMRLARNAASPTPDLGVKVPLIVQEHDIWNSLSDMSDLAVIPLPDLSSYTDLHGVSVNDFGATEDDVFQSAPILVLGYPPVIGEWPLSTPIARSGIVAWTDPSDRLGMPFLIDANVFPGNSGSPVFHIRTGLGRLGGFTIAGGLALIGILSQVAEQDITVTSKPPLGLPSQAMLPLKGLGGIGVIEPASKAKELVQEHCRPQK
jgi:V8-like Glu-specific endopeptidase